MNDDLTTEQKALRVNVTLEYIEKAFTYVPPDRAKLEEWIGWVYSLVGLEAPEVVICDSHKESLKFLTRLSRESPQTHNLAKRPTTTIYKEIINKVFNNDDLLPFGVGTAMPSLLKHIVCYRDLKLWNTFSNIYLTYGDFTMIELFEFYTRAGLIKNEYFDRYKEFCNLGVFEVLLFDTICLVVTQPPDLDVIRQLDSCNRIVDKLLNKKEFLDTTVELKAELLQANKELTTFLHTFNNQ